VTAQLQLPHVRRNCHQLVVRRFNEAGPRVVALPFGRLVLLILAGLFFRCGAGFGLQVLRQRANTICEQQFQEIHDVLSKSESVLYGPLKESPGPLSPSPHLLDRFEW